MRTERQLSVVGAALVPSPASGRRRTGDGASAAPAVKTRAFALVLAVVLLALVVLVLVMLTALTRVETSIAGNTRKFSSARQNALLGLEKAIAQLQVTDGPDQRITANAEVLELGSDPPDPANKKWVGVWDSDPTSDDYGVRIVWLVSGDGDHTSPPPAEGPGPSDGVRLVYDKTVDVSVAGNAIVVPREPIVVSEVEGLTGPQTIGHYAYWVGDEGVKARVNLVDPWEPSSGSNADDPEGRYRHQAPQRTGSEVLSTFEAIDTYAERQNLGKAHMPWQVRYAADFANITPIKSRFHDITTYSRGVLADVANGGLKLDLTPFLEGATGTDWLASEPPIAILDSGESLTFGLLRSWAQLGDETTGSGSSAEIAPRAFEADATGIVTHGVHPLVVRACLSIGTYYWSPAGGDHRVAPYLVPSFVLWNPYNITLPLSATYRIELLGNLGLNYAVTHDAGPFPSGFTFPSPLVFQISGTSFAPGEVKTFSIKPAFGRYGSASNWVEYVTPTETAATELEDIWPATNATYLFGTTDNNFPISAANAPNNATTERTGNITTLLLSVRQAAEWRECQRVEQLPPSLSDGPEGAAVPIHEDQNNLGGVDGPTPGGGATEALILRSAADMVSGGWSMRTPLESDTPFAIVRDFNPRALIAGDSSSSTEPENWVAIPALNNLAPPNTDQFYRPFAVNNPPLADTRAYFGYSLGVTGQPLNALFEIPRSDTPVMSLAKFQHVLVSPNVAMPSYLIGNSFTPPTGFPDPGPYTALNAALWDRYFLSGLPDSLTLKQTDVDNPTVELRSNRIRFIFRDGQPPQLIDIAADWIHNPAAYLWVEGAFNVNSTSVEAWKAVLASMRDVPIQNWLQSLPPAEQAVYDPDGELSDDPADKRNTLPRFAFPSIRTFDPDAGEDATSVTAWLGHRRLSDDEIYRKVDDDEFGLAAEIVKAITDRGTPFTSLAEFVNRGTGEAAGILQRAIGAAGLNSNFVEEAAAIPGYLTQADVLSALGPILTVRSDTFLVRAYGETINPVTAVVEGRAWCEAVVQRTPDRVDGGDPTEDAPGLGRRFEIVSFRWLTPDDI